MSLKQGILFKLRPLMILSLLLLFHIKKFGLKSNNILLDSVINLSNGNFRSYPLDWRGLRFLVLEELKSRMVFA